MAIPAAPSLTAIAGAGRIRLTWDEVAEADPGPPEGPGAPTPGLMYASTGSAPAAIAAPTPGLAYASYQNASAPSPDLTYTSE